jgi:hypothetical protein
MAMRTLGDARAPVAAHSTGGAPSSTKASSIDEPQAPFDESQFDESRIDECFGEFQAGYGRRRLRRTGPRFVFRSSLDQAAPMQ